MRKFVEENPFFVALPIAIIVFFSVLTWGMSLLRQPKAPDVSGSLAAAVVSQDEPIASTTPPIIDTGPRFEYIEVLDGCGPYYMGSCVNVRSGPGEEYSVVARLRTGVVLRVAETVIHGDQAWYKIKFEDGVRYPERITGDWYVAASYVQLTTDKGDELLTSDNNNATAKRIVVDLSEEVLYAYDGDVLFMKEFISTGLEFTPTPRGTFTVFKKTPSRYMQGPVPDVSDQYFDLPGVPWDLYFSHEGAVIHGAYWHDNFGKPWSHGCVNLPVQKAKELYQWTDIGTSVVVQD